MEWHFNSTPYHYCFNNPVNYIDPFGLDTIDYKVIPKPLPGVEVTAEGPGLWKRFVKWFRSQGDGSGGMGDGNSQPSGYNLTSDEEGGTGSGTKTSKDTDPPTRNITDLLIYFNYTHFGQTGFPSGGIPEATDAVSDAIQEGTSDKKVVNSNTGPAQKTNANGQPIDNNGQVTTTYWVNNSDDTISVASGDGTYNGEVYYPGDTIGSMTTREDGVKTKLVKEKKYPSR